MLGIKHGLPKLTQTELLPITQIPNTRTQKFFNSAREDLERLRKELDRIENLLELPNLKLQSLIWK